MEGSTLESPSLRPRRVQHGASSGATAVSQLLFLTHGNSLGWSRRKGKDLEAEVAACSRNRATSVLDVGPRVPESVGLQVRITLVLLSQNFWD